MEHAGRGRGRGSSDPPAQNAWAVRADSQAQQNKKSKTAYTTDTKKVEKKATRKFEDACAEIQANVKKHAAKLAEEYNDLSSEDEEVNQTGDILSQVFQLYGKNAKDIERTEQILQDSLRKGAAVCLICIGSVKKADPIWSCSKCYCSLHLHCIQRWAKDSVYFQTEAASDSLPPGQVVDATKFKWCW